MKSPGFQKSLFIFLCTPLAWCTFLFAQETYPTQWSLVPCQTDTGEWRQALQVQTVPGVVYRLQKSTTLMAGDWVNVESRYGMGQEWICPVLPSNGPPVGTLPQEVITLPSTTAETMRQAQVTIQRSAAGEPVLSWLSLDDGSMKQKVLTGFILDPVWEQFDNFYLNPHGNFFFALSLNLGSTPTIIDPAPILGTIDQSMVNTFQSNLSIISANLTNSVAAAKTYSPIAGNTGAREFFRIVADWAVDSNGSGRYDWQQLILDGTDPFSPGTGPGGTDVASSTSGSSSGYPTPTDATPAEPKIRIQQRIMFGSFNSYADDEETGSASYIDKDGNYQTFEGSDETFKTKSSLGALSGALKDLAFPPDTWLDELNSTTMARYSFEDPDQGGDYTNIYANRSQFRIILSQPAPEGGYRIKMRVLKLFYDLDNSASGVVPCPSGHTPYTDINLEVAEGAKEGTAVELPLSTDLPENYSVRYEPTQVNASLAYGAEGPADGLCLETGDEFVVNICERRGQTSYIGDIDIVWQMRRLNGAGTFSEWELMDTATGGNATGSSPSPIASEPGIFQLRALALMPGEVRIEIPFIQMRNARSIKNAKGAVNDLLKAGQSDYFGVCNNKISKDVRDKAVTWLGSTKYAFIKSVPTLLGHPNDPDTKSRSKCNIFVTHIANSVGAGTPYFIRWNLRPAAPIARDDWFGEPELNVDLDLPGWTFRAATLRPTPGMAVASPGAGGDSPTSGHVGILDYDGSWLNAGSLTVNKSIHLADSATSYKPNKFRFR